MKAHDLYEALCPGRDVDYSLYKEAFDWIIGHYESGGDLSGLDVYVIVQHTTANIKSAASKKAWQQMTEDAKDQYNELAKQVARDTEDEADAALDDYFTRGPPDEYEVDEYGFIV